MSKIACSTIPLLIVVTAGCNKQSSEEIESRSENTSAPIQTQTNSTQQAPQPRTFDIPSLLGKNIDEVTTVLGPADAEKENAIKTDSRLSQKLWTSDTQGHGLAITYRNDTRKITKFVIDSPSGPTRFVEQLLELGNLNTNDPRYTVEFTASLSQPDYYANAVVEPVYFRQITYMVSSSAPTVCITYRDERGLQTLQDVPLPWRQTVALKDDVKTLLAIGPTPDKIFLDPFSNPFTDTSTTFHRHIYNLEILQDGVHAIGENSTPGAKTNLYNCSYIVGSKISR